MTKFAALVMVVLLLAVPSACTLVKPSDTTSGSSSGSVSGSFSGSENSEGSVMSEAVKDPELKMVAAGSKIMLWPANLTEAEAAGGGEEDGYFYVLNEESFEWEPANFKAVKIGNIESKRYNGDTLSEYDVFRVTIGGWTEYIIRGGNLLVSDPSVRVLSSIYTANFTKAMHTCDHAVLQIFDDLYTIDTDDEIRMVSHRTVGGYDYETADKNGVPDLYAWEWIWQPVCSPEDNVVRYLTSREGKFYSIWSLDLDSGEEKNTGLGTAITLESSVSGISDYGIWKVEKSDGKISLFSGERDFEIEADEAYTVFAGQDYAFFAVGGVGSEKSFIKCANLTDGSITESWYGQIMTISGWEELIDK